MAASLAAGLYGIKYNLKLDIPETKGNGYKNATNGVLSKSLPEAIEKMEKSEIAKELFGDDFVKHFLKTREWECKQIDDKDPNWELKRYFEII
jgi:glutamine synthetase